MRESLDKISEDFPVEQDASLEKFITMIDKKPTIINYLTWNSSSLFDD